MPQGQNRGKKKRIDLTLRKTLTPRSSESGFHRNVKFATFQEAGRLCKTIPQNGGKSCTPGGQERPKVAPLTLHCEKLLTPRSSESGFHRNLKFATFEEAGRLCKTIPQNGVKVAPLGGRRVLKFAPLTFNGVGRPMKWAVLSIEPLFN